MKWGCVMKIKKILSCAALCALPLSGGFAQGSYMTHKEFKNTVFNSAKKFEEKYGNFDALCKSDQLDEEVKTDQNKLASFLRKSRSVLIGQKNLKQEPLEYFIKAND